MTPLLTLLHPRAAQRYYAEGHWRGDTLYALLVKHAQARPDAFALRDGRVRLTWRELERSAAGGRAFDGRATVRSRRELGCRGRGPAGVGP